MKKIKVLHLLKSSKYSGAENVVCQIIEMFKDSDIEMVYCSVDGEINKILKKRGILFFPLKNFSYIEIAKVVKSYDPDIIHAHDAQASVLSAFLIKPIIKISHLHSNSLWMSKYGINSLVYYFISKRFKNILTVSQSIMSEYVFGDYISPKLTVVGNPVDSSIVEKYKKSNEKKYDIAFCGRFEDPKDPMRFIYIIEELKKTIPNISTVMIGSGTLLNSCKKYLQEKSLKNNIKLTGFLENPFLELSNAKVLCMTSVYEGFGLVAVEAMALGCPVVCTPVGGLKEIINKNCGKKCSSDEEFHAELSCLISNPKYLKKKSDGAINQSASLNNIVNYERILNEIYLKHFIK